MSAKVENQPIPVVGVSWKIEPSGSVVIFGRGMNGQQVLLRFPSDDVDVVRQIFGGATPALNQVGRSSSDLVFTSTGATTSATFLGATPSNKASALKSFDKSSSCAALILVLGLLSNL